MTPYATVLTHQVDNLTALCEEHHGDKTHGRLHESQVREANLAPFNATQQHSTAKDVLFSGDQCDLSIGSNQITLLPTALGMSAITMNGTSLIAFRRDGKNLLLTMGLRDSSGSLCLAVIDNEITVSTQLWDVVWKGAVLTIRATAKPGDIILQLRFQPPNAIAVERLDIWHDGYRFTVGPSTEFQINGNAITSEKCQIFAGGQNWASLIAVKTGPGQAVCYGMGSMETPDALAGGLLRRSASP